jgi:aspartate kinase
LILVVSAMKGVTDLLIKAFDEHSPEILGEAVSLYIDEAVDLGLNPYVRFLELIGEELRRFVNLNEPWIRDYVIIHGELLSSMLIEGVLNDVLGIRAKAVYDPGLVTNQGWGGAEVIHELSRGRVRTMYPGLLRKYDVLVVPGFLGVTLDGRYSSLGRGGSDYTASLLASYLNASRLTFYTDSGGLLSGDPSIVNDPVLIRDICYEEAHAASIVGVKRFHPRTFEPLLRSRVLTLITSPWAEGGTYVSNRCVEAPKIVGLGAMRDGGYRVSVIGYGIARNEDFVSEIRDISSSHGFRDLIREGDHVVSIISNGKNEDVTRLVKELHGWVRKWVG